MRSPVRIWPAAPKKPDSFENQAFLRPFCSEILRPIFPDPPADPRELKKAEISPRAWFKFSCNFLSYPVIACHCLIHNMFKYKSALSQEDFSVIALGQELIQDINDLTFYTFLRLWIILPTNDEQFFAFFRKGTI